MSAHPKGTPARLREEGRLAGPGTVSLLARVVAPPFEKVPTRGVAGRPAR
ncbi:hypothetical protein ACGFSG_06490 [Streptomyces sp. NPDC048512]